MHVQFRPKESEQYKVSAVPLEAGVNTACHEAYRLMLARGFRIDLLGVAMAKPNEAGYNPAGRLWNR